MRSKKMLTILVMALGLMVLPASVASGAQYLTVDSQDVTSITLELGQLRTVEVVSTDGTSYVDYVGFDNGVVLGDFSHLETKPEAGSVASALEHNEPAFYGYLCVAAGGTSPGVHFVFQYEALQVGETDMKLYQNNPPPSAGLLIDSVHITVIPPSPKPIGTAWTYQGRLIDTNAQADGLFDFQFKLYDNPDPVYAVQQGNTIDINELDVIDGYFTVELDFGSVVFGGDSRWLEVGVRPGDSNDGNDFVTLIPRQEMTPTPYALYAETAGGDNDWRVSGDDMYAIPSGTVSVSRAHDATGPGLKVSRWFASPQLSRDWMEIDGTSIDTYYSISKPAVGTSLALNSNSSGNVILAEGGGKVGIGTTSPAEKLEVAGNEKITGDLKVGGSYFDSFSDAGTAGQILSSTGAGTNWTNLPPSGDSDWIIDGNDMYSAVSGSVGIGTTTPGSYKLKVVGAVAFQNENGSTLLCLQSSGNTARMKMKLFSNGTIAGIYGNNNDTWVASNTNGTDPTKAYIYLSNSTGGVGIGTTSPNFKLDVRGTIGNNTTLYHSDIRWKKQVKTLSNSLEKVLKLRGVSFVWRQEDHPQMGFPSGEHVGLIAQEVENVQPNLVVTGADGYKSVEYANMVALLVEAVKEQQRQFMEKDREIAELKERLEAMEGIVAKLAGQQDFGL